MMDYLFQYGLYTVAVLLILCGLVGTIIPALPGIPMIFAGVALGMLTVISIVIDWVSQSMGAERAGATKLGLTGAFLGTILGIPFGLFGIFLFPVIGAFIGEMIGHRDMRVATKVSWATWIGMMAGIALKVAIAFIMLGVMITMLLV